MPSDKRPITLILFVILLILFLSLFLPASVQAQNGGFDLAVRSIESRPADPSVGQETYYTVTYINEGPEAVPDDFVVYLNLQVTVNDTGEPIVGDCAERVESVAGLGPNRIQTFAFQSPSCDVVYRVEGFHTVWATFVPTLQEMDEPPPETFLPLEGDANPSNNGRTMTVEVQPYESALPDELGQLFAGLGMFFAVMAIVAVGTEVVIDTVKVSLGMKSKVTSLDALKQMEKYMPDKLAALGVSTASQSRFRELTASMRQTVVPISEIPDVIEKVKSGDLEAAVPLLEQFGLEKSEIEDLVQEVNDFQNTFDASFVQWRNNLNRLFERLRSGLAQLDEWSLLTPEQKAFLSELGVRLENSASKLESLNLQLVPENIDDLNDLSAEVQDTVRTIKSLVSDWQILLALFTQELINWSAQSTINWLTRKQGQLMTAVRQEIIDQFDQEVVPYLRDLDAVLTVFGSTDNRLVEESRGLLYQAIDQIETATLDETDVYLKGLEELLKGVEERRNLTQSPSRKLWRRLRQSPNGLYVLALGTGTIIFLVEFVLNLPLFRELALNDVQFGLLGVRIIGSLAGGVLFGLVTLILAALLARVGEWIYKRTHQGQPPTKKEGEVNAIDRLEILWNWLRGDTMEPDDFGSVEKKKQKVTNLTIEDVASVIFERNDQQRDEESSRVRWLRVISIAMGFIIAYLLQVDAAELLDAAVPGIEATINRVLYISGDTLHAWQPLLSSQRAITAGIILTAFAAAAGSTFWHDRLDKLQASKRSAESAAKTLQLIEGISDKEKLVN